MAIEGVDVYSLGELLLVLEPWRHRQHQPRREGEEPTLCVERPSNPIGNSITEPPAVLEESDVGGYDLGFWLNMNKRPPLCK